MDPEAATFLNFVALSVGILLTLRAVVRMDRFHAVRVVVLTVIFSCLAVYIFAQIDISPYPTDTMYFDSDIQF